MKKQDGTRAVNDDEWYTSKDTADKVASWLSRNLPPETPILCPADLLPSGEESNIPRSLREHGFCSVRVTRDLPVCQLLADWRPGEVVVTNPPFSLLSQFRKWAQSSGARFCVLSRPATMRNCWTIPELGDSFRCAGGRSVAAAWMQNIQDTRAPMDATKALGNCLDCERKACPKNDMTGSLSPGEDRALYGWGAAVKGGIAGRFCKEYTRDGKKSFSRFFR